MSPYFKSLIRNSESKFSFESIFVTPNSDNRQKLIFSNFLLPNF